MYLLGKHRLLLCKGRQKRWRIKPMPSCSSHGYSFEMELAVS